eukprot:10849313-Lingulodinium_polyedra.AAC.1
MQPAGGARYAQAGAAGPPPAPRRGGPRTAVPNRGAGARTAQQARQTAAAAVPVASVSPSRPGASLPAGPAP